MQWIDLWCGEASTCAPGPLESYCETLLPLPERRDADRFRKPSSRNQHVIGRGMARWLLASTGVEPQAIEFVFNAHGKPDVGAPAPAVRPFNIAHTEGLVVVASCDSGQIGVDVERLARSTDIAIADRYFAKPEVEYVMSRRGEAERQDAFLRVWTLKESFIKAIGRGLSIPLADFAFRDLDSPHPTVDLLNPALGDAAGWQFATAAPRPGYVAAVARYQPGSCDSIQIRLRDFDMDWISACTAES